VSSDQPPFENPLAAGLLARRFADGDTIKVGADAHTFTFDKV